MSLLRTIAILRGFQPAHPTDLAERAWASRVDLVEVPVPGESGWVSL